MQLKSSAQKSIKAKIVEQFPLIEGYMDEILTKKDSARIIKCHEHIEIVINGSGEHLFFKQRDGPYIPSLKLVHKCKRQSASLCMA
jgi:PUA domain protein